MGKAGWAVKLPTFIISLIAASLLTACGSAGTAGQVAAAGKSTTGSSGAGPAKDQHLAVADGENNRVLIFSAPFTTDESASVVLGQAGFTGQQANQGGAAGPNTLSFPRGLAMDSAGNLYVADAGNCRVLAFQPPFVTNMKASVVIGEPSQSNGSCGSGPSAVDTPISVAVDGKGNLWVVEANRVAEYTPPFRSGMTPAVVLGQTSANGDACNGAAGNSGSGSTPPTAATLCNPVGAAFDAKGDLWVADGLNGRVLEYRPPFATGMGATLELGVMGAQAFTLAGCAKGEAVAEKLCFPQALAFDSGGNLWVTTAFSGIYEFAPPFRNGMAAQMVFGKPASQSAPPTASTATIPYGIYQSGNGSLMVSDTGNNRVLMFDPPFGAAMKATTVIGQPNMTTGTDTAGATANKLWYPSGLLTY